jgi:hypothetical protein
LERKAFRCRTRCCKIRVNRLFFECLRIDETHRVVLLVFQEVLRDCLGFHNIRKGKTQ